MIPKNLQISGMDYPFRNSPEHLSLLPSLFENVIKTKLTCQDFRREEELWKYNPAKKETRLHRVRENEAGDWGDKIAAEMGMSGLPYLPLMD